MSWELVSFENSPNSSKEDIFDQRDGRFSSVKTTVWTASYGLGSISRQIIHDRKHSLVIKGSINATVAESLATMNQQLLDPDVALSILCRIL